jgi:hypothetical protein
MIYLKVVVLLLIVLLVGCAVRICECNSPQRKADIIDNNSTNKEFKIPLGI